MASSCDSKITAGPSKRIISGRRRRLDHCAAWRQVPEQDGQSAALRVRIFSYGGSPLDPGFRDRGCFLPGFSRSPWDDQGATCRWRAEFHGGWPGCRRHGAHPPCARGRRADLAQVRHAFSDLVDSLQRIGDVSLRAQWPTGAGRCWSNRPWPYPARRRRQSLRR
jgi:hypothetical protein